jgi:hypothetical protein
MQNKSLLSSLLLTFSFIGTDESDAHCHSDERTAITVELWRVWSLQLPIGVLSYSLSAETHSCLLRCKTESSTSSETLRRIHCTGTKITEDKKTEKRLRLTSAVVVSERRKRWGSVYSFDVSKHDNNKRTSYLSWMPKETSDVFFTNCVSSANLWYRRVSVRCEYSAFESCLRSWVDRA